MQPWTLDWKGHHLVLGRRTLVMGIVNVTPDSFSDGGQFYALDAALVQAKQMVAAGADIVDIGGESTRPFAKRVSAADEKARVVPVIERLAPCIKVPISIDTTKAEVAEAALAAGASIINDISALRFDPAMAPLASRHKVPIIVMHMKGDPGTMQLDPTYDDVVAEVSHFLSDTIQKAVAAGIQRDRIIIDPGIGFGKTGRHNLILLQQLQQLGRLNAPLLVGPSRKRFIRDILKPPGQKDIPADQPEVETGTQAAVAAAVMNGAHIVRVHNVANTVAMVRVLDAIRNEQSF
jgi:dihydropteroate synthase